MFLLLILFLLLSDFGCSSRDSVTRSKPEPLKYTPGHFISKQVFDRYTEEIDKLSMNSYEWEGVGSERLQNLSNHWSTATYCEHIPAIYQVFSSPESEVYYGPFSPPEERYSADYQMSEDSGAGFRVVWQLKVDAQGKPTNQPPYRMISVITFWDYDFNTGRFIPTSGADGFRVRAEAWELDESDYDNLTAQSYTINLDKRGSVSHIEPGAYRTKYNDLIDERLSDYHFMEKCSDCHNSSKSRVHPHSYENILDHTGYKVLFAYLTDDNYDKVLSEAFHGLEVNNLEPHHAYGRKTVRTQLFSPFYDFPQAKQHAHRLAMKAQTMQGAKELFKYPGLTDFLSVEWSRLTAPGGACESVVKSLEDKKYFDETILPVSKRKVINNLDEYLNIDQKFLNDKSGLILKSPISGDYRDSLDQFKKSLLNEGSIVEDASILNVHFFSLGEKPEFRFKSTFNIYNLEKNRYLTQTFEYDAKYQDGFYVTRQTDNSTSALNLMELSEK